LLIGAICLVVEWPLVLASLLQAEIVWMLAALACVQVQVVLSAERWRLTALRLGCHLSRTHAVGEYYLATLLNQLLPGGVAGDLLRVARNGRRTGSASSARSVASMPRMAQSVVVERLAGQLALFIVLIFGMAAWPLLSDEAVPRAGWLAVFALCGLALVVVVTVRLIAYRASGRVRAAIEQFGPDLRRCWFEDRAWRRQVPLGLLISLSYVAVFLIVGRAIGETLPPAAWLLIVPLTLFGMLLPVGIGGWGVREAVAAVLWPLAGLSAEAGVATGILYGIVSLVGSLPGAFRLLPRVGLRMSRTKSSTSRGR